MITDDKPKAPEPVTMYSTQWCGYCRRLKLQLTEAGIDFVEVDIEQDEDAAAIVERAARGTRTVPTVVLPDGTALVNPPVRDIVQGLLAGS